jgi:NAD(P)-dependent dehydrogenase (short-subunit alcohol dehydrogenase family)
MPEDFLKSPASLFDVKGKTAIITGATGAFGALAAQVLAGAGCHLVLAAGGTEALKKVVVANSSAPKPKRSISGRARQPIATRSSKPR